MLDAIELALLHDSSGVLDLSYHSLNEIPIDLINLELLLRYYLSFDQKEDLAPSLLKRFWHVDLSYNNLGCGFVRYVWVFTADPELAIPDAFTATFQHISYLNISGNCFTALPPALLDLRHLRQLHVNITLPRLVIKQDTHTHLGKQDSLLATCAHLLCREIREDPRISSLLPEHLEALLKIDCYTCDSCATFVSPFHTSDMYNPSAHIHVLHIPRCHDWVHTYNTVKIAMDVAKRGSNADLSWHQLHLKLSRALVRSPTLMPHQLYQLPTRLCQHCWGRHKQGGLGCGCHFCRRQMDVSINSLAVKEWPAWLLVAPSIHG